MVELVEVTERSESSGLTASLTVLVRTGDESAPRLSVKGPESSRVMTSHDIPPDSSPRSLARGRLENLGYCAGIQPEATRLPTATRLWLDWESLARSRSNVRRANSWALPGEPVHHLDDVLRRAGYGQSVTDDDCDAYLSRLTAIARHDELACRIVVQRILPGLIAIALRRGRIVTEGASFALDQLVASAWMVIRGYPIERRPIHVAANLLRDVEYQSFVREARTKRSRTEVTADSWTIVNGETLSATRGLPVRGASAPITDDDPVSAACELSNLLHDLERLGLRDIDREAIEEMLSDRLSPESAELAGISARALRDRRAAAIKRSRELLGLAT